MSTWELEGVPLIAPPPGAGRDASWVQTYDAAQSTHAMRSRGGNYFDMQEQTSTLGFGAIQTNFRILRGNSAAWKITGQAVQFKFRAWPALAQPAASYNRPSALFGVEVEMSWDANPAGLGESGLLFSANGNMRQPRINNANTHAAFGVINIGGVLNWISQRAAPLAREIVPLGNGTPLIGASAWNKVRIEIHSATATRAAHVRVYVNDKLSLVRSWDANNVYLPDLDATFAAFLPELIQADTSDLYFRGLTFFDGPDLASL